MESNSQLQEQMQSQKISEVSLSKIPFEQRWKFMEADLRACDVSKENLDKFFADYYTAVYFIATDYSASAYTLRAFNDYAQKVFAQRRDDSKGVPVYVPMLGALLGKCDALNNAQEFNKLLNDNSATFQVLLPGFPQYSKGLTDDAMVRALFKLTECDYRYFWCGLTTGVLEMLFHTGYRPRVVSKTLVRERFLESYGVEDPLSAMALIPLEVKELTRRVCTNLAKFVNDGTPNSTPVPDVATKGQAATSNDGADEGDDFDEDDADEGTDGKGKVPGRKKSGRGRNTLVFIPSVRTPPIFKSVIDMLDVQLKLAHLPELTKPQRDLLSLYMALRLEVWNLPIICENKYEQLKLQNSEASFEYLKDIDVKMLQDEDLGHFDPQALLHYHDPRECFGNCIYDTLNDFIMPLTSPPESPAYAYEQQLKEAVEKALVYPQSCIKLNFREPQLSTQKAFVHETWYLWSIDGLGFGNREYKGKTPFQGWKSVFCRTISYSSMDEVKQGLADTAENFKRLRTRFFEEHEDEILAMQEYDDHPVDVVTMLVDNLLDNYSLGVMVGPKGSVPGYVQTSLPVANGKGLGYFDGANIIPPDMHRDVEITEYYLCSMHPNLQAMVQMIESLGPKEMIFDFYEHMHPAKMKDMHTKTHENYTEIDQLRNIVQTEMRILHSRQAATGEVMPMQLVRSMMQRDMYYTLDSFILFGWIYHYILEIEENHKREDAEEAAELERKAKEKAEAAANAAADQDSDDESYDKASKGSSAKAKGAKGKSGKNKSGVVSDESAYEDADEDADESEENISYDEEAFEKEMDNFASDDL